MCRFSFNLLIHSDLKRNIGGGKIVVIFLLTIIFNLLFIACTDTGFLTVDKTNISQYPHNLPSVNIYLENSKSIDGYMSNGEQSLMSDLRLLYTCIDKQNIDIYLNYINSQIIPQDSIREFFDINAFDRAGGNRSISNIIDCFDSILKRETNSVNILVSDFVVAGTSDECTRAQYNLTDALIGAVKKDSTFSMIVMQMIGEFNGKCYWGTGKNKEILHSKRPYYICIMGPCSQIVKTIDIDKLKNVNSV